MFDNFSFKTALASRVVLSRRARLFFSRCFASFARALMPPSPTLAPACRTIHPCVRHAHLRHRGTWLLLLGAATLASAHLSHAASRKSEPHPTLTTAAQVQSIDNASPHNLSVHLTGTVAYYDPAAQLLLLKDPSGTLLLHLHKTYPIHPGDTISVIGTALFNHSPELSPDLQIQILTPAVTVHPWLRLSFLEKFMAAIGFLALGVGIWAAFLRSRVANQNAWIDRTVVLAGERSRILELISSNTSLHQVLNEIRIATERLLPGTQCSYHLRLGDEAVESEPQPDRAPRAGRRVFDIDVRDSEQAASGYVVLSTLDQRAFPADGNEVYQLLAELADLAVRQTLLYRRLVHHSTHDPLTELPNRRLYESRLQAALEDAEACGGQMAVIYIDINRFKHVNDQYGHKVGDLYLQQISTRLRGQLRPVDMLARIGGDEFVVVAPFPEGHDRAFALTARLQRCFEEPFELEGVSIDGSASFGFARYPEHGRSAEALTRHADHAMYIAKHEHSLSEEQHGFAAITAHELELAYFNGWYRLAYQPQFSASGRLTGLEALLRLDHPILGLLTPDAFIGVAEKHSIIIDIGAWVLRRAVQDAIAWNLDGGDEVTLSVNVSSRQLEEVGYARSVLSCLREHNFPPSRLELELIERNLMLGSHRAMEQLTLLREAGVRISLDDFGTEQSCLSMLHKLPIDTIKLDKSFIRAMDTEPAVIPIIRAIVSMAQSLGKRVVAEAIENVSPIPALMQMGEMDFQGYLLSRPVPSAQIPTVLDEWRSGIRMPAAFSVEEESTSLLTVLPVQRIRIA